MCQTESLGRCVIENEQMSRYWTGELDSSQTRSNMHPWLAYKTCSFWCWQNWYQSINQLSISGQAHIWDRQNRRDRHNKHYTRRLHRELPKKNTHTNHKISLNCATILFWEHCTRLPNLPVRQFDFSFYFILNVPVASHSCAHAAFLAKLYHIIPVSITFFHLPATILAFRTYYHG